MMKKLLAKGQTKSNPTNVRCAVSHTKTKDEIQQSLHGTDWKCLSRCRDEEIRLNASRITAHRMLLLQRLYATNKLLLFTAKAAMPQWQSQSHHKHARHWCLGMLEACLGPGTAEAAHRLGGPFTLLQLHPGPSQCSSHTWACQHDTVTNQQLQQASTARCLTWYV